MTTGAFHIRNSFLQTPSSGAAEWLGCGLFQGLIADGRRVEGQRTGTKLNIGRPRPHGRSHGGDGAGRQGVPAREFHEPACRTMQCGAWRVQDLFSILSMDGTIELEHVKDVIYVGRLVQSQTDSTGSLSPRSVKKQILQSSARCRVR